MNLESTPSKKLAAATEDDFLMEDFDFKPITSGLGFHQGKPADVKPVFTERTVPVQATANPLTRSTPKKEMSVYQNDLSMFYNQPQINQEAQPVIPEIPSTEDNFRIAKRSLRVSAYLVDLFFIVSVLAMVVTVMARTINMNLMEVWSAYPQEITPLVAILFIGFYIIYFSVFEKSPGSTIGKNIYSLKVVDSSNEPLSFSTLMLRTFITLINFISLGLFSYFDLQNKVTSSKVIKVK